MNKKLLDTLATAAQPQNSDQWYFYVLVVAVVVIVFIYLKYGRKESVKLQKLEDDLRKLELIVQDHATRIKQFGKSDDDQWERFKDIQADTTKIMEKIGEIKGMLQ